MKTRLLSWLLLPVLALGLLTACSKTEETAEPAAEVAPIQAAEPVQTDPTRAELAAQPGMEEETCAHYTLAEDFGAALQSFVEASDCYTFENTSTTGKSALYTVADAGEDLVLVRVYTHEDQVDHFFVKFSYNWASSDNAFAYVSRVVKFCTKSAIEGMTNEAYDAMAQEVGMANLSDMIAYSTGAAAFPYDTQWELTKNTGTLQTATYVDQAGNTFELGFYILNKSDDPNYFALTVTPAGATGEE